MSEEDVITEEEVRKALGYGYPEAEEKQNLIAFFREIIRRKENIKTGNLTEPEVGFAKTPARTNLDIANYCDLMGMSGFGEVFQQDAQVLLGTSLSRDGFLDKLAVTQKKQSETSLKKMDPQQRKRGLFRGKQPEQYDI